MKALSTHAVLVGAAGVWAVRRLDDSAHPRVWRREPVAALTLGREHGRVVLVPVLLDSTVAPLRPAVEGRDGADHLQRGDAVPDCRCALPVVDEHEPAWCACCTGRVST